MAATHAAGSTARALHRSAPISRASMRNSADAIPREYTSPDSVFLIGLSLLPKTYYIYVYIYLQTGSYYESGWPWTCSGPPVSTSQMLNSRCEPPHLVKDLFSIPFHSSFTALLSTWGSRTILHFQTNSRQPRCFRKQRISLSCKLWFKIIRIPGDICRYSGPKRTANEISLKKCFVNQN